MSVARKWVRAAAFALLLGACGGGGGGDGGSGIGACSGSCQASLPVPASLSITEVETVIAQAVQEAQARGAAATIAVVDRVGTFLAYFA